MVVRYLYCFDGVDCSLCFDLLVDRGFSMIVKHLESSYVGGPQKQTMGRTDILMLGLCSPYSLGGCGIEHIFSPEVLSQLPVSKPLLFSWTDCVLRTCRGFSICCCFLFLGYLGLYQLPGLHQDPAHKECKDDPLHLTERNSGRRNTHDKMKSQER